MELTPPMFHVGQILRYRHAFAHMKVLEDPSTCIHNERPAYQLQAVGVSNAFYRFQTEIESGEWSPALDADYINGWFTPISPSRSTPPFALHDVVRHVKTGGLYTIVGLPSVFTLEASGLPAYAYSNGKKTFVRAQTEMEDGRFVLEVSLNLT